MSKIVLITGGSGGIGAEVARRVAAQGGKPVLVARNPERPAAVATETGAAAYSADVLDDPAFGELVERVEAEVGAIDGVVHAIGSVFLKPLHATSLADWRSTFEINATSAFFVMRKRMPLLMRRKRGSVVLFFHRGGSCARRRSATRVTGSASTPSRRHSRGRNCPKRCGRTTRCWPLQSRCTL
jgi:NAD(P)-dependent dehydrogenase (short-subunit alcohol dehydrogenase family)